MAPSSGRRKRESMGEFDKSVRLLENSFRELFLIDSCFIAVFIECHGYIVNLQVAITCSNELNDRFTKETGNGKGTMCSLTMSVQLSLRHIVVVV